MLLWYVFVVFCFVHTMLSFLLWCFDLVCFIVFCYFWYYLLLFIVLWFCMLCFFLLCYVCVVLCYVALYCIVLCCIVLCCLVFWCLVLCYRHRRWLFMLTARVYACADFAITEVYQKGSITVKFSAKWLENIFFTPRAFNILYW